MGKALIIKGADFSSVSAGQVITDYNPIGVVDLTQYDNLHLAVNPTTAGDPLKVTRNLPGCDTFVVPVIPGESYTVKFCSGASTLIVGGLSGLAPEYGTIGRGYEGLTNCVADIYSVSSASNGEQSFVIPTGVASIIITGRNSSHSGFVPGYALTLTRTA